MQRKLASDIYSWLINCVSIVVFCLFIVPVIIIHSMNWINPAFSTFMLGHKISQPASPIDFEWKNIEEISGSVPLAIIAAEDQLFPQRLGFNFDLLGQAIKQQQIGLAFPTTSAISQHTARNLFLWSGKSSQNSYIESWLAFLLETSLDKRRILEIYMNISEFSPGVYGVEAASRKFFYKPAKQLGGKEAASLAAVFADSEEFIASVKSPSATFEQRQRLIIDDMKVLDKALVLQNVSKKISNASLF